MPSLRGLRVPPPFLLLIVATNAAPALAQGTARVLDIQPGARQNGHPVGFSYPSGRSEPVMYAIRCGVHNRSTPSGSPTSIRVMVPARLDSRPAGES